MATSGGPNLVKTSRDIQGSEAHRRGGVWQPGVVARSSTGYAGGNDGSKMDQVKTLDNDPDDLLDDDGHSKRTVRLPFRIRRRRISAPMRCRLLITFGELGIRSVIRNLLGLS
jgi:hypothetical protein